MSDGPLAGKRAYLALAAAIFVLDQWSKWWVELRLPAHSSREIVPGLFHLSHVRNSGVAWGMLPAQGDGRAVAILVVLGAAALAFVGWLFASTPATDRRALTGLGLVLGGAVGNLVDRLASGAVTDFLGVYLGSYRWPDFNVADSAISIGVVLLLLDSFLPKQEPRAESS